jgi:hypothetical protein
MVTLDFSKCKTVKDVETVWGDNEAIIPSVSKIVSLLDGK